MQGGETVWILVWAFGVVTVMGRGRYWYLLGSGWADGRARHRRALYNEDVSPFLHQFFSVLWTFI